MKINNEFTVDAPVETAWDTMLDLERVAPCLPGASLQEAQENGEYEGSIQVKIGPVITDYRGTIKVDEADEENRRVVLKASGRDAKGQGSASATIVSTMQGEDGGQTKVSAETDMELTGRAAQFGRGIAQDVATSMLDQFASCLEKEIAGGGSQQQSEQTAESTEQEASSEEQSGADGQRATEAPEGTDEQIAPLDLGSVSRDALLKRGAPILGALAGLGLTALLLTRALRRPSFRIVFKGFEIRRG